MNKHKPEITYPCEWTIKIIGSNEKLMLDAASKIIIDCPYVISPSNKSKTGKYISLKIKLTFQSENERQDLYTKLSEHKDIKFVL